MKHTKAKLLSSITIMLVCFAMLLGSTYAWFTDQATTGVNTIQAGNLDIQLLNEAGTDSIEGGTLSWTKASGYENEEVLWEPGVTYYSQGFQIKNAGNLALKFKITINGLSGDAELLDAIDFYLTSDKSKNLETSNAVSAFDSEYHLAAGEFWKVNSSATSNVIYLAGHMKEEAGNDYQGLSIDNIGITLAATQDTFESDSFNKDYDQNAVYPVIPMLNNTKLTGNITVAEGGTLGNMNDENSPTMAQIIVPESAVTENINAEFSMKLTSTTSDSTTYEISLVNKSTQQSISLSKPATVTANIGTNLINVKVNHNGIDMTLAESEEQKGNDGYYSYDRTTGIVTIWTKSFSPFTFTYEFDGVASLNGIAYPSIKAAINSAKSGDTIVMMKDYSSSDILINLVSESEKNITVDLNGKTLTYTGTNRAVQVAYAGANLTIKNGTINKGNATLGVAALFDPTVNLDNVTINGSCIDVYGYSGANITMKKVIINAESESSNFGAIYTVLNTKLNMEDCKISSSNVGVMSEDINNNITINNSNINSNYFGVYHNGSYAPCNVTIKNSNIVDTYGNGVYISNSAGRALQTLNIENSTIVGPTGVEIKHTNATITNSKLVATATPTASGTNNNGTCTSGYALAVTTNGVNDFVTGTVNVNDTKFYTGSVEGTEGYVFVYKVHEDSSVSIDNTSVTDYNTYGGEINSSSE